MTKPSDFILNTDYLSIAQTSTKTQTLLVPASIIATQSNLEYDFNYVEHAGTVSRFLIRAGDDFYTVGNELIVKPIWDSSNKVLGNIRVYRISDTQCRFSLTYQNMNSDPINNPSSCPEMLYSIKIASFKSPNV